MNTELTFLLSLSCVLPLVVYLFTSQRADWRYLPLIFVFLFAFLVETSVYLNMKYFHVKGGMYWIYTFGLLVWTGFYLRFFRFMDVIRSRKSAEIIFVGFLVLIFCNWFFLYKKEGFFNFFRMGIAYASIILFFYVNLFSRQILSENRDLLRSPLFYIGLAGVSFHAFYIFTGTITLLKLSDGGFMNAVQDIMKWVNAISYLIFAIGILWIPQTKTSIKSS